MEKQLRDFMVGKSVSITMVEDSIRITADAVSKHIRIKERFKDMDNLWLDHVVDIKDSPVIECLEFRDFRSEDGALIYSLDIDFEDSDIDSNVAWFTLDYYGRALVGTSDYFEFVEVK